MWTIPIKLQVAKLSQALAMEDVAKGALFGQRLDPLLPLKIYIVRKSVEFTYDNMPNDADLVGMSNLMIALCQKYAMRAYAIISGATGGSVIIPITPTPPTISTSMPFYFAKKADFGSATDYTNTALVGKDIAVFLQSANRYLNEAEYVLLVGGVVRILVDGFDSQTFSTGEYIMRVDINGVAAPSTIVDTFNYVLDSITTITDLPSGADYQTRRVIIRPNGHQYYWAGGFEFNDLHPEQTDAYGADTMQIYDFMYNPVTGKNECVGQTINIAI